MNVKTDKSAADTRTRMILKIILIAIAVLVLLVTARYFDIPALFRAALAFIDAAGPGGPLVFFGLYIIACVLMLPGSILTLGAGVVFGLVRGIILVSFSATAGATTAFLVGRYLARGMVARQIQKNAKFQAVDQAVAAEGWKIVGLTRLSPIFPFNFLNYAFGLTSVSLRDYILASWIGMLPGTAMYVYLGSIAGNLAELGAGTGSHTRSPAQWVFYIVGLLATVAVTLYITRIARRALERHIKPAAAMEEEPT